MRPLNCSRRLPFWESSALASPAQSSAAATIMAGIAGRFTFSSSLLMLRRALTTSGCRCVVAGLGFGHGYEARLAVLAGPADTMREEAADEVPHRLHDFRDPRAPPADPDH